MDKIAIICFLIVAMCYIIAQKIELRECRKEKNIRLKLCFDLDFQLRAKNQEIKKLEDEKEKLTDDKLELERKLYDCEKAYIFLQNNLADTIIEKTSLKEKMKYAEKTNEMLRKGITDSVKKDVLLTRPFYIRYMMGK